MEIIFKYSTGSRFNIDRIKLLDKKFIKKSSSSSFFEYCGVTCSIDNSDFNLYMIDSLLNKKLINISILIDDYNYCDIYYPHISNMNIIDNTIVINIKFEYYHNEENIIMSRYLKLNNILK